MAVLERGPEAYVPDDEAQIIISAAQRVWRDRVGAPEVLKTAGEEGKLSNLVWEFDAASDQLNRTWLSLPATSLHGYWNIRALSQHLNGRELSLVQQPTMGTKELRTFLQLTRDMNGAMERFEYGERNEPILSFAASSELTPDQALLGGTIQVLGRYVAERLGEDPDSLIPVDRDGEEPVYVDLKTVIMDSWLEAVVLDGSLSEFSFYNEAREMDWYGDPSRHQGESATFSAGVASLAYLRRED